MKQLEVQNFNLKYTLECGQFFRYRFDSYTGFYYVQSRDKVFKIRQTNDSILEYKGATEKFIIDLLGIDFDYNSMLKCVTKDKHVRRAVKEFNGLRLMRQDPWECSVSYICSAASNIPKIQLNLELLSKNFGNLKKFDGKEFFTFPKPGEIDCYDTVRDCKAGFRSKYLIELNKKDAKFFSGLKKMKYLDAKKELMTIPGIGSKVADCICLFSLDIGEAFPIDVWIRRIMLELYFGNDESVKDKEILEFAWKKWGKYAGYAQEFLYILAREK